VDPRVTGLALVGAGRMGTTHLQALARARRVQLRAICDPSPTALALGAQAGVPVDSGFEQTLNRDDVHAVLIAAPTPLHESLVAAALAAGKHVLCEKPLTFDPQADLRLAAEADRRGLGLHVGFWRRHAWPYREARRLIAEGAIGEPRLLRLAQWDAEPPPAAFCDPAVSGGIEVDCGVHECDLAAWLCGSPVVEAFARGAPTSAAIAAVGDVESLAGMLVLAAGQPVSIDLARTAAHSDLVRSEIVGAHGSLICEAHGAGALLVRQDDGFREVLPPTDDVLLDALARQIDALAAAAAGGPVPDAARPSDAAAALRVALALQQSRRSGAPVRL
jgi:myo-inositol 2-dehydrogenase/D-chiro-inositol 1-dehydrogenase